MTVTVNGAARTLARPFLTDLLAALSLDPGRPGIAVAVNGAVVPRARWDATALRDGDAVEIVRAFQGG